jgi:hypothetical protein
LYVIVPGVHTIIYRVSLCFGKALFPRHLGSIFRAYAPLTFSSRIFFLQIVTASCLMLTINNLLSLILYTTWVRVPLNYYSYVPCLSPCSKACLTDCFHSSAQIWKCFDMLSCTNMLMGHAVAYRRHYATSRKVVSSRPDEVNEFFQFT